MSATDTDQPPWISDNGTFRCTLPTQDHFADCCQLLELDDSLQAMTNWKLCVDDRTADTENFLSNITRQMDYYQKGYGLGKLSYLGDALRQQGKIVNDFDTHARKYDANHAETYSSGRTIENVISRYTQGQLQEDVSQYLDLHANWRQRTGGPSLRPKSDPGGLEGREIRESCYGDPGTQRARYEHFAELTSAISAFHSTEEAQRRIGHPINFSAVSFNMIQAESALFDKVSEQEWAEYQSGIRCSRGNS